MPPPEGEAVVPKVTDLVATWTDADGGTLTLRQDGTFTADRVCVAVRWYEGLAWSGTGTWTQGANGRRSLVGLTFDADHSVDAYHPENTERRPDPYTALRQGKALKLWVAVGDPDNDQPHCILTRPAG
ncbi:hypothetical protein ACIRBY_16160 [Streptomyces sp. NPDC096136]|uniref:hypothetical protein n=1 Tax=Streptomyces sp. NPDC096136 TaxID=3366076 RepID=UPI0037F67C7D